LDKKETRIFIITGRNILSIKANYNIPERPKKELFYIDYQEETMFVFLSLRVLKPKGIII